MAEFSRLVNYVWKTLRCRLRENFSSDLIHRIAFALMSPEFDDVTNEWVIKYRDEAERIAARAENRKFRYELFPAEAERVLRAAEKARKEAEQNKKTAEPRPVQNTEGATIPVAWEQIERGEIPNDLIRQLLQKIAADPADRNAATAAKLLERIRQLEPPKSAPEPGPVPATEPAKATRYWMGEPCHWVEDDLCSACAET